ncbi:MAG: hypothetical protein H7A49_00785 [Akkermansiaceae bacterium]|nr:hypothetical protein [Akkermansiaceae bacterium]
MTSAMQRGIALFAALTRFNAPAEEVRPALKLASPRITEASGIAASLRHPGALWIVNDSGAGPELHLVGEDGADRGSVALRNTRNRDWEDLASFEWKGRPYLLVADTGDNASKHEMCSLVVVAEPSVGKDGRLLAGNVAAAWKIDFRYEDGPRDCESVAVDPAAGTILLLSKRTAPPALYELPLVPGTQAPQTAKRIGETRAERPGGTLLPFGNQPTGMDVSPDASRAAIVTYNGWFLVVRGEGETWSAAFARGAVWQGPHLLPQAESIAFSRDGSEVFLTSEGTHPKLLRFPVVELR